MRDKDGRDQFFGEYKPPRINRRQGPVVFFSIDSTVYYKRKQKSKKKKEESSDNSHK
jgi:hypothetical protein